MAKRRKRNTKKTKQGPLFFFIMGGLLLLFLSYPLTALKTHYSSQQTASLTEATLYPYPLPFFAQQKSQGNATITDYYLLKIGNKRLSYAKILLDQKTYYVSTKSLALQQDNPINQWLELNHYPHVEIKEHLQSFAKLPYETTWKEPNGIVVHDTGNETSTIESEIRYMTNHYQTSGVFVHSFIDDYNIITIADPNYMAQGAGPYANGRFIQFELVHAHEATAFARQIGNAAYYTAYQLKKHQLPLTLGQENGTGTLWTHEMVSTYLGGTDHTDPIAYWQTSAQDFFGSTYTIEDFQNLVQSYYNQL